MRYFIYLSYDGTAYHGWQIQPNGESVQETLQRALATLLHQEVAVTGAGRTDAGVHAALMVAHFDVEAPLGEDGIGSLVYRLNAILPHDIAIHRIVPVPPDAHARFSARAPIIIMCTPASHPSCETVPGGSSKRLILRR